MSENAHFDSAIREIRRAQGLVAQIQQSVVKLGPHSHQIKESALPLTKKVQQICSVALSKLESAGKMETEVRTKSSSPASCSILSSLCQDDLDAGSTSPRRGRKRTRSDHSIEIRTNTPYNDGYQWRKYGEKNISGSSFQRLYYRCSYKKEHSCQAKKQVQQQNFHDPPMFIVTYNGEHTCKASSSIIDTSNHHMSDLSLIERQFVLRFNSTAYYNNEAKRVGHDHPAASSASFSSESRIDKTPGNYGESSSGVINNYSDMIKHCEAFLPPIDTVRNGSADGETSSSPRSDALSATSQLIDSSNCISIESAEMTETNFTGQAEGIPTSNFDGAFPLENLIQALYFTELDYTN